MKYIQIEKEDFENVVEYSASAPSGLIWKIKVGKMIKGSFVGSLRNDGYWQFRYKGVIYRNHRVIASLFDMKIDEFDIDHIDGNPSNNNLENLRCVKPCDNQKNKGMNKNNTSGITGVRVMSIIQKSGNIDYYWQCQWISEFGKNNSKSFSIKKYGHSEALILAIEYRRLKISKIQVKLKSSGFIGYSDRHLKNTKLENHE